ncbi:hypothetical protein [Thermocoleostomius sinensis]|uniref:Excalibur calcium-binding domain-containing protein n=1 Tax=Thermocoleostomius sinensis A174 TaxID=2016057 RepID=A0A9E9C928_9CYAN|nr:hypothetical protein [Thermocoleostomius sinensis]WAL59072.1 hypothetical protein OXH18_18105 [Thermocoleostomius sinensis A174]
MKSLIAGVGFSVLTSSVGTGEIFELQPFIRLEPDSGAGTSQSQRSETIPDIPIPVIVESPTQTIEQPQIIETAKPVPFEALSFCDQLDAIARDGKSVAKFVINSGMLPEYDWAAKSQCQWHKEQVEVASYVAKHPAAAIVETVVYIYQDMQPKKGSTENSESAVTTVDAADSRAKTETVVTSEPSTEAEAAEPACEPSYPDFCIPPNLENLDCRTLGRRGFRVVGKDPYNFDVDRDWVGCE